MSYGSRTARLVAFSALVTPRLAPHSGQSKCYQVSMRYHGVCVQRTDNDPNLQSDTELTGSVIARGVCVSPGGKIILEVICRRVEIDRPLSLRSHHTPSFPPHLLNHAC